MNAPRRPDPDALLRQVTQAERRERRGRLKIFFGSAPGVGKTFAMLEDARARRAEGLDVVVGVVETHGRADTAAMLHDLEVLPRRNLEYQGVGLQEFDLEAALARHPALLLVDELAHTNAPGSRHAKRWQDVEELLAAGVNVSTTLNVQHIESLNDVVAQITGVVVRETVPDSILDEADEIELADLSPEDLLQRLRQGKVYLGEQAARAVEQFFRKGNLIALRELALRRVADRVDAEMRGYMAEQGIRDTWPAGERLLVGIGPGPRANRLVRAARRIAGRMHADWIAAHVETPADATLDADAREAMLEALELAEHLGGRSVTLTGQDTAVELLAYAREHNVTRILVGRPPPAGWRRLFGRSLVERLVRGEGDHDVYVLAGGKLSGTVPRVPARGDGVAAEVRWAAIVVAVCSVISWALFRQVSVTDVAMIYLLGAVVVALRCGPRVTLAAVVLSIALLDFLFVPPYFTFRVSDLRFTLTFAVMLVVGAVISLLTIRIRAQAEAARSRERRAAALYALGRDLAAADDAAAIAVVAVRHIRGILGGDAWLLLPGGGGELTMPAASAGAEPVGEKDRSVADWVFRNGRPAGADTDTLPAASHRWVPLPAPSGCAGVVGLRPPELGRLDTPEDRRLLEAMASQVGLALERTRLRDAAQQGAVEVEAERLRTALLSSLSHDLRTPLAAITGSASSLLADTGQVDPARRRDLAQTVLEEAERMNRLVGNLLDMVRLESGVLAVQRDWLPLEEPIGVALIRLDERLRAHPVEVRLPEGLPLVPIDGILVEQVFVNLLENAARYTPAGSPVEISAVARPGEVEVSVADRGPGIPAGEEERIFQKFYRGSGGGHAGGVGLGLTICRGIVTAHGGRMWAERRPGGGLDFRFTLPIVGTAPEMPVEVPEAAEPETHDDSRAAGPGR